MIDPSVLMDAVAVAQQTAQPSGGGGGLSGDQFRDIILSLGIAGEVAAIIYVVKMMLGFQQSDREESRKSRQEQYAALDRNTKAMEDNSSLMHEMIAMLRAMNGHAKN